jgi:ribosome biogenesis GTPase
LKKKNTKAAFSPDSPVSSGSSHGREGLITSHHGVAVDVLFADGQRTMARVKRRSGHVVGDRVMVRGEIMHRLPRETELLRRDANGGVHIVGANLDVLGVVVAPLPRPPAGFIDRAIVAARAADLKPFIIINKCDLEAATEFVKTLRGAYEGTVPVFPVSAANGDGLDLLKDFMGMGYRGSFVGTTGVGKSSLLNALCPELFLRVGKLNDYTGQGCNTTTVSTLHALAGGGELIDTPGFQDFGLVDISVQDLASHFPGFEHALEETCRFRNCRHRSEPGCAVIDLVAHGQVSAERYGTYLEILGEVEASEIEARRRDWKNA